MTMTEIEARLAAIPAELEKDGADLDALEQEVRNLTAEKQKITTTAEKRKALIAEITSNGEGAPIMRKAEKPADPYNTPEYRNAWAKAIRGLPMTDAEKRAYSNGTGTGAEVIPTALANQIIDKMKTIAPMLNEIDLLSVAGNVKYAVEGTNNAASIHTENATITAAADTLATVSLGGYEITKLVQISDTVKTMSIPAFETWIVNKLAEALARKVEDLIISGSGTSEPKGIDKANTWGADNSITVAKTGTLSTQNVLDLIGLLNAGYDSNAKFLMSKRTLFTDFMPLQDKAKNDIVTMEGKNYYIFGYPVLISDYMTLHEAYLGDYRKVVGNMPESMSVKSAFDINTNSYKYLGVCMFDCTPALGEAVVKLVKAST